MIKVENINKSFNNLQVLQNLSLQVAKGEVVSIIGPSGSGKSTLLRCLNQLERIDSGKIIIEGEELTKEISKKLGMVFQGFNLFPHKNVLENIIEAPLIVKKMNKTQAITLAEKLLQEVGLLDKVDNYPSQLSGGQKQRIAITRALAMKPHIMLFDEPTSALDPELVGDVLEVIKELVKEDMTMLIVTHQMEFAKEISDRIIFMDEGSILEEARPLDLFENPQHTRVQEFLSRML